MGSVGIGLEPTRLTAASCAFPFYSELAAALSMA
jgi:hypothetical protein